MSSDLGKSSDPRSAPDEIVYARAALTGARIDPRTRLLLNARFARCTGVVGVYESAGIVAPWGGQ